MEGDKKQVEEPECLEGEKTNPSQIHEYEFFVREGEGEMGTVPPEDRKGKKGKKGYRNKSRIFFLD